MPTKAIDVSYAQGVINWGKVKAAGITQAIIRATASYPHGTASGVDKRFKSNIEGALAAGIDCGVYHYCYALSVEEAKLEANHFINTIKPYKLTLPVVLDFEDNTQTKLSPAVKADICDAFLQIVQSAGYYAMLYSMASWLKSDLSDARLSKYDKWVAHVGTPKPAYSGNYGIWQFSWEGKVDGISGDVDMNYVYRDYPTIIKNAGLNGWAGQDKPTTTTVETVPKSDYDALQVKYNALMESNTETKAKYDALINGMKALIGG